VGRQIVTDVTRRTPAERASSPCTPHQVAIVLPDSVLSCLSFLLSQGGTIIATMNIIAVKFLRVFWEKHPDAEQALKSWVDEARKAAWTQPAEIKERYRSASILKNRRVVFNIKGNDYRLVVSVAYHYQAIYVKFIGTHQEYDAIDAETVEMEV
jgi:mRNA interferase HigB